MPSLSQVAISNMALGHVGVSVTIESMTENSNAAKRCNQWYDHARQEALEGYNWSFARKRKVLAEHSEDPPAEWAYRYQYPADALAVREIENPIMRGQNREPVPYSVEMADDGTKSILTDLEDATAIYTFDQSVVAMFSRHFVTTFSYRLAHYIAFPLTGKKTIKDDMEKVFTRYLMRAPAVDASEAQADPPPDSDWIAGR